MSTSNYTKLLSLALLLISTLTLSAQNLSFTATEVCVGNPTDFTATGDIAVFDSIAWDFGDPSTTTDFDDGPNVSYTYPVAGAYFAIIKGFNNINGLVASDTIQVIVNPKPNLNLPASVDVCALNYQIQTGLDPDRFNFVWSTTQTTTSINVSTSGAYSVTVVDKVTSCTSTDNIIVNFISNPVQADAGPDKTICPPDLGQIGGSDDAIVLGSGVGPYTYKWEPATGLNFDTVPNPFVFTENTISYTLTVTDSRGCTSQDVVVVFGKPVVDAGPDVIQLCTGDTATLGGNPTASDGAGGFVYRWEPANLVDDPTAPNPKAFPIGRTTFTVTVTDQSNCPASDEILVDVRSTGVTAFAGANNDRVCDSSSVILGGQNNSSTGSSGIAPYKYVWEPNIRINDTSIANPIAIITDPITYTVTVTDAFGCSDVDSVSFGIDPEPAPKLNYPDTVVCLFEPIQFGDGGVDYDKDIRLLSFRWFPADSVDNDRVFNPIANIKDTTSFTVQVTSPEGCLSEASFTVDVRPLPEPEIITLEDTYCEDDDEDTLLLYPIRSTISGPGIRVADDSIRVSSFSIENEEVYTFNTAPRAISVSGFDGGRVGVEVSLDSICFVFNNSPLTGDALPIGDITIAVEKDGLQVPIFDISGNSPICDADTGRFCLIPGPGNTVDGFCSEPFNGTFTALVDLDTFDFKQVTADGNWNFIVKDVGLDNSIGSFFRFDSIQIHFSQNIAIFNPASAYAEIAPDTSFALADIVLTGFTRDGCDKTIIQRVRINQSPNSSLIEDVFICRGGVVNVGDYGVYAADGNPFSDSPFYEFSWSENIDEVQRNEQFPSVFDIDTTTAYIVTITDSLGCNKVDTLTARVFRVDPGDEQFACIGVQRLIGTTPGYNGTNAIPADVNLNWTSQNPIILPPADNNQIFYQASVIGPDTLMYYGEAGVCKDSAQLIIEVNPNPIAIASDQAVLDTLSACIGDELKLGSPLNNQLNKKFEWNIFPGVVGDPNNNAGDILADDRDSSEPVITVSDTFRYTFVVTDTVTGCVSRDSVTVNAVEKPTVEITLDGVVAPRNVPSFCMGNVAELDANINYGRGSTASGSAEDWTGDPNTDYLSSIITARTDFVPLEEGDFAFVLTVTNDFGCEATDSIDFTVVAAPVPQLKDTSICAETDATIFGEEISGATGFTYAWDAEAPLRINSANNIPAIVISSDVPGTYTLSLTLAKGSCSNTAIADITVLPLPDLVYNGPQFVFLCASGDDYTQFEFFDTDFSVSNGTGPYSYEWKPSGDVSDPNSLNTIVFASGGSTTYNVEVTDANGCKSVNDPTRPIQISVIPMPIPTLKPDTFACEDYPFYPAVPPYSANLSAITPGLIVTPPTYILDNGRGEVTTNPADSFIFNGNTTYTLEVIYESIVPVTQRGGAQCSAKATTLIQPGCRTFINLPNVFTPEEGQNGNFGMIYKNKEFFLNIDPDVFNLAIFDRWGKMVFETTDLNTAWDGNDMKSGEKLPPATYTWVITGMFRSKEMIKESGSVTLIR